MNKSKVICLCLISVLFSCQLNDKTIEKVEKLSKNDHFEKTMVKSQFFTLNLAKNNTIESKKGNVIIVPEGSFVDKNGSIVKDDVQIEFAEATELDEINENKNYMFYREK